MSKKKLIFSAIVLLLVLVTFYCGNDTTEVPETAKSDPSFKDDIQPIFTNNCALSGCHNSTASEGLILLEGQAYSNIVNVDSRQDQTKKLVLPSDATNSYLVIKIEGRQQVGSRMPLGRSALSDIQIQNIKNWVNRGAKNN